jgi:hypothetical protein
MTLILSRAGGAAERLREMQAKSPEGPDGITSVIPAPSKARNLSSDTSSSATPAVTNPEKIAEKLEKPEASPATKSSNGIPEVKITVPGSERPSSVEGPITQEPVPEKPKARELKRPKHSSDIMQKELASLGIDPIILGGRGTDLVSAWDEFGWVGEGVHTKNIEQMREEVERELNKVQAGGWLSRLEEEDERVDAIQKGLDKVIDECDELDGLLTLYLVELGVSVITMNGSPTLLTTSRLSMKILHTSKLSPKVSKYKQQTRNFCKSNSSLSSKLYRYPQKTLQVSAKHHWSHLVVLTRSRSH